MVIIAQSGKNHSFKAGHEQVEGIAWVREVEQDESEAVMRRGSVFPVGGRQSSRVPELSRATFRSGINLVGNWRVGPFRSG